VGRIELSGAISKDTHVEISQTADFMQPEVIATRTATDGMDVPLAQSAWRIELKNSPVTRFVRVSHAGQGQMSISELKVFGRY
jgi:hypothetical protein